MAIPVNVYGRSGSAKAKRREPATCLGLVFNYKLACFEYVREIYVCGRTLTSIIENVVQVLPC